MVGTSGLYTTYLACRGFCAISHPNVLVQKVHLYKVFILYLFRREGIWYYQLMENEGENSIYGSLKFSI